MDRLIRWKNRNIPETYINRPNEKKKKKKKKEKILLKRNFDERGP